MKNLSLKSSLFVLCILCTSLFAVSCKKIGAGNGEGSTSSGTGKIETVSKKEPSGQAKKELEALIKPEVPNAVLFYADYCPACKRFKPIVSGLIESEFSSINLVKISMEEKPELARILKVDAIPTLILFKKGAVYQETLTGAVEESKLKEELKGIV